MKLTPYGKKEILIMAILTLIAVSGTTIGSLAVGNPWLSLFGLPILAFGVFCIGFFRDPERKAPSGSEYILSPADGLVTHIEDVPETPYMDSPSKKISIFMSLFNVHVNRSPVSGKVEFIQHRDGKFLNAGDPACMTQNENNITGINSIHGKIAVKQIAGVIARRIVCDLHVGDEVKAGERFGMIKFSSRLEVFVPVNTPWEVRVKPGDNVRAGETIIGEFLDEKN